MEEAGGSPAVELLRWTVAERFGWTLDYIDSLPYSELREFVAIEDGREKSKPQKKNKPRSTIKGR